MPAIVVSTITKNVEVGRGRHAFSATGAPYALFAAVAAGRSFLPGQDRERGLAGYAELAAPSDDPAARSTQFPNPDVEAPKVANAAALGQKVEAKSARRRRDDDGDGAERERRRRARPRTRQLPARAARLHDPDCRRTTLEPNAPTQTTSTRRSTTTRRRSGAKAAAVALKKLIEPADVQPVPKDAARCARSTRARCCMFVAGHDVPQHDRRRARRQTVPKQQQPTVRYDARRASELLRAVREAGAVQADGADGPRAQLGPGHASGDKPSRLYWIDKTRKHKARPARLPHRRQRVLGRPGDRLGRRARPRATGASSTDLKGRDYDLYYSGPHLHMVVLRAGRGELLGREHAARLALERDDARDRQGPQAALTSVK